MSYNRLIYGGENCYDVAANPLLYSRNNRITSLLFDAIDDVGKSQFKFHAGVDIIDIFQQHPMYCDITPSKIRFEEKTATCGHFSTCGCRILVELDFDLHRKTLICNGEILISE